MITSYLKTLKMAKQKIAITVEEELLKLVETKLAEGLFRNRSHFIEYSIKKMLLEEKKNENV